LRGVGFIGENIGPAFRSEEEGWKKKKTGPDLKFKKGPKFNKHTAAKGRSGRGSPGEGKKAQHKGGKNRDDPVYGKKMWGFAGFPNKFKKEGVKK